MAMFIKAIGKTKKLMEKVFIAIEMGLLILDNGLKICNMDLELKNGQMDLLMKGKTNFI
jgi:hypothetical protein